MIRSDRQIRTCAITLVSTAVFALLQGCESPTGPSAPSTHGGPAHVLNRFTPVVVESLSDLLTRGESGDNIGIFRVDGDEYISTDCGEYAGFCGSNGRSFSTTPGYATLVEPCSAFDIQVDMIVSDAGSIHVAESGPQGSVDETCKLHIPKNHQPNAVGFRITIGADRAAWDSQTGGLGFVTKKFDFGATAQ